MSYYYVPEARPTWSDLRANARTADDVLRAFGVDRAPVPVDEIIRGMGIELHFAGDQEWSGALDARHAIPRIFVATNQGSARQRFTMAHELGHLMLHPLGVIFRDTRFNDRVDPVEVQANKFAADLLMPRWLLDAYRAYYRTPGELATAFDVSLMAMEIRLGLV